MTPLSDNHTPRTRQGVTLAEVLISMGILTVGLLGAAALFPVGGYYMQEGDVADRAAAIAQAALDDAIIRGHLDPENWMSLNTDQLSTGASVVLAQPLGTALREAQRLLAEPVPGPRDTMTSFANNMGSLYLNGFYGAAYVIDPLGMTAALDNDPVLAPPARAYQGYDESQPARRFPASQGRLDFQNLAAVGPSWAPWALETAQASRPSWPVRRVTTAFPSAGWNNTNFRFMQPLAEDLFRADEDHAVMLPDTSDDPSRLRWDTWDDDNDPSNGVFPASRQARGDYTWIISVSPGSAQARDALATQPDAYPYDVSVVVFHKRVLGQGGEGALREERLVDARVVTTGTSGGELLLERRDTNLDADIEESPFEELRTGQYVMLCGPHRLSTPSNPIFFLQWYKVLNIESSGEHQLGGTNNTTTLNADERVLVGLRGPDWPWQPTGDLTQTDQLANDLRVAIIPGAVAVHTKTMRLEAGSAWSVE